MKEPTMEEVLGLVEFYRCGKGSLRVRKILGDVCGDVCGDVFGSIKGSVWANVWGNVQGKIQGREWQYVETPKECAIRLIREGKGDEAIKVLEEDDD